MVFSLRGSLGERFRRAAEQRATRAQSRATPFEIGMVVASVAIVLAVTIIVNTGLAARWTTPTPSAGQSGVASPEHLRE